MGKNIVQKIIDAHYVSGDKKPGKEVAVRIDQTLTQDATGTMAYLQFEAMGVPRVKTEKSVSYVDHNTLQEGFENADDHLYLQTVAAKHGIFYSRAGNGICHQVHVERFGAPGKTMLGSDSHTPTGGRDRDDGDRGGGLDVAVAMAGGPFYMTYPKVVKVNLTGKLQPWVAAKDVILKLLEILTTKGNVGTIVEYGGDGVETLSVPERATITNMGAELGVTTSIFPSDKVTKAFLKAQGREDAYVKLKADASAKYERVIDIDLSALEPMVAMPHSPDNVKRVKELAGKQVHQVLVGSCTNASYKDITTLARILKDRTVSPNVSFGVAPGSRQVLQMAAKESSIATLVGAGARILETACGFCIGAGQAPPSGGVSVRTNNRNFEGRSGTKDAGIFLVSAETAAACALKGEMADPRDVATELGIAYPEVKVPKKFHIDDSMVLPPAAEGAAVSVRRGPNIGKPPESAPLPEAIRGAVTLKVGDKITTDHIMPAGARLKYRSNIAKYAEFVFEGVDPTFSRRSLENKTKGVHNVIVGGRLLRARLLARTRGDLPELSRRARGHHKEVRADPLREPDQLRHRAVPLRERGRLRQDRPGGPGRNPERSGGDPERNEAQGAQRHEGDRLRGDPLPDRAADRYHPGRRAPRVHEGERVVLTDIIMGPAASQRRAGLRSWLAVR